MFFIVSLQSYIRREGCKINALSCQCIPSAGHKRISRISLGSRAPSIQNDGLQSSSEPPFGGLFLASSLRSTYEFLYKSQCLGITQIHSEKYETGTKWNKVKICYRFPLSKMNIFLCYVFLSTGVSFFLAI